MSKHGVKHIIDGSKFNNFHFLLLLWCASIIVFDGYDLVIYGSVVPVLMQEWNLTAIQTGAIGSYTLIGMMVGALIFGPLADKIGRKKVIIICVTVFSTFTLLAGFSQGPTSFSVYRFLAGIGLGGVMPNVIALMTDYAPKFIRNTLVSMVFIGYSIGGILAAIFGIIFTPTIWQAVFWIGGLPLLLIPLMIKTLPESINYLLKKEKYKQLGKILQKIEPHHQPRATYKNEEVETKKSMPVIKLFEKKRGLSTLMFWCANFMCLFMIYGLNTWLPKLMSNAGFPLGSSITFLLIIHLGAIVGTLIGGNLADKISIKKVLIFYNLLGGLSIFLLGFSSNSLILYSLVFIAGAGIIGSQNIANSYISQYYPAYIRSTGSGMAFGIGRIGAIIGPTLGGIMLAMNVTLLTNFLVFAIPGVIAAIAILLVQEQYGNNNNFSKVNPFGSNTSVSEQTVSELT